MKKFILPIIEIVEIDCDEIISTSGEVEGGFEPGPNKPIDLSDFW